MEAKQLEKRIYTYSDIKKFPEDERWELINGIPYLQARPSLEHQSIMSNIHGQIWSYLQGKPCRVFTETSVWLEGQNDDHAKEYVVPDIVVICDHNKMVPEGVVGAPDMVIEIVSPSTANVDRNKKLRDYRIFGVKEYWIVDPIGKFISVHTLHNDFYRIDTFSEGKVKVNIFEDLFIDLDLVFSVED